MNLLEKLPVHVHEDNTGVNSNGQHTEVQVRVSVVDAMHDRGSMPRQTWMG